MMLRGKGVWAYRESELDRAIQIAPLMGATHVLYKVGQGETYYPRMAQIAQKIRDAGLVPFGWAWLLLDDPYAEAQVVRWAFDDGFEGYIFDTESDQCRNRFDQAADLGRHLRDAEIDPDRLYNCSFPNITHHRDLPYDQMNAYCRGGLMPMSYGTYYAPGSDVPPQRQAQRVIDEWTYGHYAYWCRRWTYSPPMAPVLGPYHDEYGKVRMPPGEFQIWLDRLAAHGPSFFSVFTAAVINDDLLPLMRAFRLGEAAAPTPAKLEVEVVSPEVGYLNVRPTPSTDLPPVTQVDHGTRLEALESETDVWAKVGRYGQWLRIRTPDGIEAYVAAWYLKTVSYEPVSFGALAVEAVPSRPEVEVVSPEMGFLNVRPSPDAQERVLTQVDDKTTLAVLEPEADVQAKVGEEDEWLHVGTPDGFEGFVPAQYTRLPERRPVAFAATGEAPAAERVQATVVPPKAGYLNVWQTPSTEWPPITRLYEGDTVKALEPEEDARAKIGQPGAWLNVLTPDGAAGFVQARHLRPVEPEPVGFAIPIAPAILTAEAAPEAGVEVKVGTPPAGYLNIWETPSTDRPPIARAFGGESLEALATEAEVRARAGQRGAWLRVRTADGVEGYTLSQHLRLPAVEEVAFGAPIAAAPAAAAKKVMVEVVSPEVGYLNVRPRPSIERPPVTKVYDGDMLEALGPEERVRASVGQEGQWLYIRTPGGIKGYAAAWYLRLPGAPAPEGVWVRVVSPEAGYLNVRPSPSIDQPPIAQVKHGDVLESLEPETDTLAQVGRFDRWLHIRTPDGREGYAAAWYLSLDGGAAPEEEEEVTGEPVSTLDVQSSVGLNIRQGQGTHTPITWHVDDGTTLEVLDDPAKAGGKVGKDRWIKVRTPSLREGYVNGLYVKPKRLADKRQQVDDARLPAGESAWIFGIHAADSGTPADFRFLFQNTHRTGWVLYTEGVGTNPYHSGGGDYRAWSDNGYGVIVRLNHSYEPGGTLPVRSKYADFARACVRFVQNSKGCHIWIIGNEQNNVREHPGGADHPTEHITPLMFAEAFNLARRQIKAVQPEAIVVPGAVDPYNTYPWARAGNMRTRPLEYFKEMLSHIEDLDGIALHTYTHWMDVSLITKPTVFQDVFLQPGTPYEHYYDFLAYRPFAEAIPEKWRDRPIYITESNHWLALEHQPRNPQEEGQIGWVNKDAGWVQAAYAEINRWNSTPHAQQIQCLLLYRWVSDEWAIKDKGEIHKDFRKALSHDYRWRR
jgi:hypothetical protein